MTRRFVIALALCAALTLALASGAAAEDLAVQSVNTSSYPQIALTLSVPPAAAGAQPTGVRVWENSVEIGSAKIESLSQQRGPVDVVLVIDTSGSMQGAPLKNAQAAAVRFIEKMGPGDRVALIAFGASPKTVSDFTSDRAALTAAVGSLSANGETSLYDGVTRAVEMAGGSTAPQRAVVLLSDGKDTVSATSLDVATAAAKQAGVPVYAVGLRSPDYDSKALAAMARSSGGRVTSVTDSASLVSIFSTISDELQNSYRVTFTSRKPNTPDLEIRLEVQGMGTPLNKAVFISNPLFDAGATPVVPLPQRTLGEWVAAAVSETGVVLFSALCVGLLGFALLSAIIRGRRPIDELAYYDQVHAPEREKGRESSLDESRNRVMGLVDTVAQARGFTGLARTKLERAGLPLRANEYMFLHFLLVLIVGLLVQISVGNPLLTALVVVLATAGPIMVLGSLETRRVKAFDEQLPDILTLIAGSLRAGWGLQQSIDLVVQQAAEPAVAEFKRVQAEVRLGLSLDQSLMRVAERIGSADFKWTASAIAIQRDVGGNLAEVLETLAATIRERAELRREVKSLTAEGRLSAWVLGVLPFILGGALFFARRSYLFVMLGSWMGMGGLILGVVLLIIGITWLNRIVNIDV